MRRKIMIKSGKYMEPLLLTITSFSEDVEGEVISAMPDIPPCDEKGCEFVNNIWQGEDLPDGQSIDYCVYIKGDNLYSHVDISEMDVLTRMKLMERLEKFIESEIDIIKNGY